MTATAQYMNVGTTKRALLALRAIVRGKPFAFEARVRGRKPLHFIHVGKTGGTAIKHALEGCSLTEEYRVILHEHDYTLAMVPPGETTAFFLRDPVARFRSGFEDRQRQGRPRYYYRWSKAEELAFSRFGSADELGQTLGSQDADQRMAAEHAMRSIQHVRDSYKSIFGSLDDIRGRMDRIGFVGFQEDLMTGFDGFKRFARLPSSLELPVNDEKAHRFTGERQPLSEEAVSNLRKWYAEDYGIYEFLRARY